MENYDFSGWATRSNVLCSDGRTILPDAFKHMDGVEVPLVYNHSHSDIEDVLGKARLEHRDGDIYAYCTFNGSQKAAVGREGVKHGDIKYLSIYANQLKHRGSYVEHGNIREVSLVLAGANPEAVIDDIIMHSGMTVSDDACVFLGGKIIPVDVTDQSDTMAHTDMNKEKEDAKMTEEKNTTGSSKSVQDVIDGMSDEQKKAMFYLIGKVVEDEDEEGDDEEMKHNIFEQDTDDRTYLSHADQSDILALARSNGVGSFREALDIYASEHSDVLAHGIDDIETLFPEHHNLTPGAPEMLTTDQGWISNVLNGVHKSPYGRIKTRQADARIAELKARSHTKGEQKQILANIKLLGRTTESQMIYVKDEADRETILEINDFNYVEYLYKIMRMTLNETLAIAMMIGDGREDGEPGKISEEKIRPIWTDADLYTIKAAIDMDAARASVQGTDTSVYFSDDFIRANAIRAAALNARRDYKGSGNLEFYCTPGTVTSMLLANDRNGHPICASKSAMADQLDVKTVHTVEQFNNITRVTADGKTMRLIGIMVNLSDYTVGCVKGGEITKFEQFDIDFNNYKYLMETFLCGALVKPYSAIVIEEEVTTA